jgi:hypothetical protein
VKLSLYVFAVSFLTLDHNTSYIILDEALYWFLQSLQTSSAIKPADKLQGLYFLGVAISSYCVSLRIAIQLSLRHF